MLLDLIAFELRYHRRQTLIRVAAPILFLLGVALSQARFGPNAIQVGGPFHLTMSVALMTLLFPILASLTAGGAILRDEESQMDGIIFTTNITHAQFVISRFVGWFLILFGLLVLITSGMLLGSYLPFPFATPPASFQPTTYLWVLLVIGVPNLLLSLSLIFAAGALTRNSMVTYLSGVVLYIVYWAGSILGNSPVMAQSSPLAPEKADAAVLLEPYALVAMNVITRHWTVLEKNQMLLPLEGTFLLNRLLWTGFALCLFALTYRFFAFRKRNRAVKTDTAETEKHSEAGGYQLLEPLAFDLKHELRAVWSTTKIHARYLLRGKIFAAVMLLWLALCLLVLDESLNKGELRTPLIPTTELFLNSLVPVMIKLGALIMIFFSAEIHGHARRFGIEALAFTTPISNPVLTLGQLLPLGLLALILSLTPILPAILMQSAAGHIDLPLYLSLVMRVGLPLILVAGLCLFLLNMTRNRYLGMGLCFALILPFSGFILPTSPGISSPLFRLGYQPTLLFSPLAGDAFSDVPSQYHLWLGFGVILGILIQSQSRLRGVFGVRSFSPRWLPLAVVVCLGSIILPFMELRNGYKDEDVIHDSHQRRLRNADYERAYAHLRNTSQPSITGVTANLHFNEHSRALAIKASLRLENKTDEPLAEAVLFGTFEWDTDARFEGNKDPRFPVVTLTYNPPLKPGEAHTLSLSTLYQTKGYAPLNGEAYILKKGAYIELDKVLPDLGLNYSWIIRDPRRRQRYQLPPLPKVTVPDQVDPGYWVDLDVTVDSSTDLSQVGVGRIQSREQVGDRQKIRYRTRSAQHLQWAVALGRYEEISKQVDDVRVTVYHQPGRAENVETVLQGAADALQTYSRIYGPYPNGHLRIAALPLFSRQFGGTSYPGTIYVTESRSLLLASEKGEIDVNYRLMAHEIAHQWWGGELQPAIAPGFRLLTEFPAVLSEQMLYQDRHGSEDISSYLDITDDLYFYIRGFGSSTEPSLHRNRNHSHVTYFKGAYAANLLITTLGQAKTSNILGDFFRNNPFPNQPLADALVDHLLSHVDKPWQALIKEALTDTVTYDLRLVDATVSETEAGMNLTVEAGVLQVGRGADGRAYERPYKGPIEVGLTFADGSSEIRLAHLTEIESERLSIDIQKPPTEVTLDPKRRFLEADRGDNQLEPGLSGSNGEG